MAAWTCALAPDAVDDYTLAILLAKRAVQQKPDDPSALQTVGAVLFRARQFHEALVHLTAAVTVADDNMSLAYGWYFLAMTHDRLGNVDDSRGFLDRANRQTNRKLKDTVNPASWNQRLTLELLRKEATQLLGIPVEAQKPKTDHEGKKSKIPPSRDT